MFFLQMGCEVKIRIVGRKNGSEPWIEDGYKMYETRLRPSTVDLMTIWHKNNDELVKNVLSEAEKGHTIILLDPLGKKMKSEVFSESMYKWLENGGSRLTFVIGGADGLPDDLRFDLNDPMKQSTYSVTRFQMMSLSDLTFTHQFARTLLAEQIYRATEIRKGSGYHK
jgi:23S rRNA (pseudouridine1915-N3)-methyltransferase